MALKKCPLCELNYIDEHDEMCDVCQRQRRGHNAHDEYTVCVVCGEHPAVSDLGLCSLCMDGREDMTSGTIAAEITEVGLDPVSTAVIDGGLDDIEIPIENEDDIPESEYQEIATELELGDDEDAEFDSGSDEPNMDAYPVTEGHKNDPGASPKQ